MQRENTTPSEYTFDCLSSNRIIAALASDALPLMGKLSLFQTIDSTNRFLLEAARQAQNGSVCLTETQTAGRGRHGREWISPHGANIYLSVLWRLPLCIAQQGISLAVGVLLVETLTAMGFAGIGLKWPNDIFYQRRKLAGILIELTNHESKLCNIVIGIGLNVHLPPISLAAIDQPAIDLSTLDSTRKIDRNVLVAEIINKLLPELNHYAGLTQYQQRWNHLDIFRGELLQIATPQEIVVGNNLGIDENGALLLNCHGTIRRFYSGNVGLYTARSMP